MSEELTNEQKITKLQKEIDYFSYKTLTDNGFDEKKLLELFSELHESECSNCYNSFWISKECKGDLQKEDGSSLEVYVNQTTNGGYEGDYFAGDIYVKIKENLYLAWSYSC